MRAKLRCARMYGHTSSLFLFNYNQNCNRFKILFEVQNIKFHECDILNNQLNAHSLETIL